MWSLFPSHNSHFLISVNSIPAIPYTYEPDGLQRQPASTMPDETPDKDSLLYLIGLCRRQAQETHQDHTYFDFLDELEGEVPTLGPESRRHALISIACFRSLIHGKQPGAPLTRIRMGNAEAAALRIAFYRCLPVALVLGSYTSGFYWICRPSDDPRLSTLVRPLSDPERWLNIVRDGTTRLKFAMHLKWYMGFMRNDLAPPFAHLAAQLEAQTTSAIVATCGGHGLIRLPGHAPHRPCPIESFYAALGFMTPSQPEPTTGLPQDWHIGTPIPSPRTYPQVYDEISTFFDTERLPTKIAFTHGNLTRENILCDEEGGIVEIIGWEYAGWLPAWWERGHFWGACPAEIMSLMAESPRATQGNISGTTDFDGVDDENITVEEVQKDSTLENPQPEGDPLVSSTEESFVSRKRSGEALDVHYNWDEGYSEIQELPAALQQGRDRIQRLQEMLEAEEFDEEKFYEELHDAESAEEDIDALWSRYLQSISSHEEDTLDFVWYWLLHKVGVFDDDGFKADHESICTIMNAWHDKGVTSKYQPSCTLTKEEHTATQPA